MGRLFLGCRRDGFDTRLAAYLVGWQRGNTGVTLRHRHQQPTAPSNSQLSSLGRCLRGGGPLVGRVHHGCSQLALSEH